MTLNLFRGEDEPERFWLFSGHHKETRKPFRPLIEAKSLEEAERLAEKQVWSPKFDGVYDSIEECLVSAGGMTPEAAKAHLQEKHDEADHRAWLARRKRCMLMGHSGWLQVLEGGNQRSRRQPPKLTLWKNDKRPSRIPQREKPKSPAPFGGFAA